ncbi:MAG: DNA double-strand break repair nuclease NurA [Coleofasciculaceae cyanobacterium SM2_1_6]|nr:DNA double-strand break repair nuclease NurA [Coleofasciculaceae cyanobacterium SM2_1_6]
MLDLSQLARQLPGISQHLKSEATTSRLRLERARNLLIEIQPETDDFIAIQEEWRDRLTFAVATPVESLDTRVDIDPPPPSHTIVATDGSQISPSHHEIAYCYLINVGRIVLHYGQSLHPILDSIPEVFYRQEDLYISQQWGIKTEEWMGYRRTVSETVMLVELSLEIQNLLLRKSAAPLLALVDGSLIYWFLESLPPEARDTIIQPILAAWDQLAAAKIPLIGYISSSRSSESLNFLRLPACTFPTHNCVVNCAEKVQKLPCQIFDPLRDSNLWGSVLEPGQRSPLWRSSTKILDSYGQHRVYFCYLHVGSEIARIEMPEWVALDQELLGRSLSLVIAQVQKGYGYPVALAEAHNQAVVRGSDRSRFFSLLEQQMIKAGIKNVGVSYKESRKRGSIA